MTERKLTLSGGPDAPYTVVLDGQDLSNGIRRLTIDVDAATRREEYPQVVAELAVSTVEIATLGVEGSRFEVSMPDEAREALIALGWTPPADER